MQRIGTFALTTAAVLAMQGCVILPDQDHSFDPFFSEPSSNPRSGNFMPVGNHLSAPKSRSPSGNSCADNMQPGASDQSCWFFPVMRFY